MGKYRKKPVEIEAIQLTEYNWDEIKAFCETHRSPGDSYDIDTFCPAGDNVLWADRGIKAELWNKLHSTWVGVKMNHWIIKGVQGEFYPCDPEGFEASYEAVKDS